MKLKKERWGGGVLKKCNETFHWLDRKCYYDYFDTKNGIVIFCCVKRGIFDNVSKVFLT